MFEEYMKQIFVAVTDLIGKELNAYFLLTAEERRWNEEKGEFEIDDCTKIRLLKDILTVYYREK